MTSIQYFYRLQSYIILFSYTCISNATIQYYNNLKINIIEKHCENQKIKKKTPQHITFLIFY